MQRLSDMALPRQVAVLDTATGEASGSQAPRPDFSITNAVALKIQTFNKAVRDILSKQPRPEGRSQDYPK